MVIQVTNYCNLRCPHCFQNSDEFGKDMDFETFKRAIDLANYLKDRFVSISGGEPTAFVDVERFWKYADEHLNRDCVLTLVTNGEFIRDHNKVEMVSRMIFGTVRRTYVQITSVRGLYSNYDFIQKYKKAIERKFKKRVTIEDKEIVNMKIMGRAEFSRSSKIIKKFVNDKYTMSCAKHALVCAQSSNVEEYSSIQLSSLSSCLPFIAFNGDLKIGESILCKTVSNINEDNNDTIFSKMISFKPCGKCVDYKERFINRCEPDMIKTKMILGIKY